MRNLISIIIPTYNGEKYISECIQSIQKQDVPCEIIVIDDISTDNTVKIAKSMGCKVIVKEKRSGQVVSKNIGINISQGEFWLTIDQDDMLCDGALKNLQKEICKDDVIVMSKLQDFPQTSEQQKFCKREAYRGILTGAALFRKSVFKKIGYFREDIITGDVIDLTNRLKNCGLSIKNIDIVTCKRRIHNFNFGKTNQKEEYKDYAKLLRQRIKL